MVIELIGKENNSRKVWIALTLILMGTLPEGIQADKNKSMANSVQQANNQLAFDLYKQFEREPGNLFFSPYSIEAALAMTYEGARGKTLEEMNKVLRLPKDREAVRETFTQIGNIFKERKDPYVLNLANALWAQEGFSFSKEYLALVERYYDGKAKNVDFKKNSENVRIQINSWIEGKTSGRIKDLIAPGMVNEMTRLILTNAIYFKGRWSVPFDKDFTKETDFQVNAVKTIKVSMMRPTDDSFNYAEAEDFQMLEIPYLGNSLSMIVLLPKNRDLLKIEESLVLEKFQKWQGLLRKTEVDLFLPKFKFETKYFMAKTLEKMGMATAFSMPEDYGGKADFSGMTGKKDLFVGEVIHQAFVEVNEEGTEAAAATAIVAPTGAAFNERRRTIFKVDHPFIFLIQEKKTGLILFIGRVIDPS